MLREFHLPYIMRKNLSYLEFPELLVVVAVAEVEVGELPPERRDQQQLPPVRRPQRARLVLLDGGEILLRNLKKILKMPI